MYKYQEDFIQQLVKLFLLKNIEKFWKSKTKTQIDRKLTKKKRDKKNKHKKCYFAKNLPKKYFLGMDVFQKRFLEKNKKKKKRETRKN